MPTPKTQGISPAPDARSVRFIKGVGPEKAKVLARLGIHTFHDLFQTYPRRYEQRFPVLEPEDLVEGQKACVWGRISARTVLRFGPARGLFKAVLKGDKQSLFAVFFGQPFLSQTFKPGHLAILYGTPEKSGRQWQMTHPEYEVFKDSIIDTPHHGRWTPIYPLTEDLTQKSIRQILWEALRLTEGVIPDWLSADRLERNELVSLDTAIRKIHFPDNEALLRKARERLVFDEFFLLRVLIEKKRAELRKVRPELSQQTPDSLVRAFSSTLPFTLTTGQTQVIEEIAKDLASGRTMNRLIQADVGSGKTAVAAAAVFLTAKNGFQSAFMAPTEVLAQQLFLRLSEFLGPHGIRLGYLSSDTAVADRAELLALVKNGSIDVLVGTHALLEKEVIFHRLGLAVVDEQHKFGVAQRDLLRQKSGQAVHYLTLTATPIPRTLALTLFGAMDLSQIFEKPAGRGRVETVWMDQAEREVLYRWLESLLAQGAQGFVVCPWVDSEKDIHVKNVEAMRSVLSHRFRSHSVGILHGRMASDQKRAAMDSFRRGTTKILVTTVVIEVGVDVPGARFMVIENADKFGLAQLHQLRGRVGRGEGDAYCILVSDASSDISQERLAAFADQADGFEVARADLSARGSGEFHGQKQHGQLKLRLGDLVRDEALLKAASKEAATLVGSDPELKSPQARSIRQVLRNRFGHHNERGGGVG